MALPPDDKKNPADKPTTGTPAQRTTPPPLDKSPAYSEARKAAIAQATERQLKADDKTATGTGTANNVTGNSNASVSASSAGAERMKTQITDSTATTKTSVTAASRDIGEYPEIKDSLKSRQTDDASDNKGGAPVSGNLAKPSAGANAKAGAAGGVAAGTDEKSIATSTTSTDHKVDSTNRVSSSQATDKTSTRADVKPDVKTVTNRVDEPRRRMAPPPGSEQRSMTRPANGPRRADEGYRRRPDDRRPAPPRGYRPARAHAAPRRRMGPPPGSSRKGAIVRRGRPVAYHTVNPATPHEGSPWGPLLIGLLLLAAVAWYAVKHYTPQIERDLANRSNQALSGEGLANANVEIDGRTAILSGSVADSEEKDLAEETVAGIFGVRAVDNQLSIGSGSETVVEPRSQPSFAISKSGDSIEVTGTVSDSRYASAMEDAVTAHYGADKVNASITVDESATNPGWMSAVSQLVPELDKVENGGLSIESGTLTLSGSSDADTKAQIGELANELIAGQLDVENLIDAPVVEEEVQPEPEPAAEPEPEPVAEPEPTVEPEPVAAPEVPKLPAFAAIRATDDGVTVNGFMSAEGAEQLVAALGTDKPVTNNISIDDRAETPGWTSKLGDSLTALSAANVAAPAVTMTRAGSIKLRGVVESEEAKNAAAAAIGDVYGDEFEIANDIDVVVPPPVPTLNPFASVTEADDTVTITGLLPPATAKAISSSYRRAGKSVIENVTRDERVIEPEWTDAFSQVLDGMANVENRAVLVNSSGDITLKGTVEDDQTKQTVNDNVTALFGDSVSLRNDIQVTPTIVPADELTKLFDSIDLSGIRFASNSAELTDNSIDILDQVADALSTISDVPVEISGHTDSAGSYDYNLTLSAQRAEAVRDYLINRGVDANRLQSRGFGPSRPVASNETRAGRALNRRIEFKISGE